MSGPFDVLYRGRPRRRKNEYVTGTGQRLIGVHPVDEDCIHHGCVIHQPSHHHMRDWPTNWREDRQLMERICPHRIGHPDPDHIAHLRRQRGAGFASAEAVHGCDGCCQMVAVYRPQPR